MCLIGIDDISLPTLSTGLENCIYLVTQKRNEDAICSEKTHEVRGITYVLSVY